MDSIKNIMDLPAQEEKTTSSKICENHGEYENERTMLPFNPERSFDRKRGQRFIDSGCPVCVKEKRIAMEKNNKSCFDRRVQDSVLNALRLAVIPKRYSGINLYEITASGEEQASIIARCKKFVEKFSELKAMGSSLIFTGKPGTGKTMIALATVDAIIKNRFSEVYDPEEDYVSYAGQLHSLPVAVYVNTYDLFAEIKATFNKTSQETELDMIKKYTSSELLVLDEVGAQVGTDFEAMLMFRIINARYENMRPTFIISNLTEKDLSTYIGERVVDRFHENHGAVFVFNWDSYRRK